MTAAAPARRVLPNLLVIGAMRAGSSSTWDHLRGHPDVFMSARKELHFFDREDNWSRGVDWYASWFAAAGRAPVVGEATPAYSRFPQVRAVPERAARLLPHARLLYVVRDPAERIRSHYQHAVAHGEESLPFVEAVMTRSAYLDASRYALQLGRWLEHYPREQVLVLQSERLRTDREAALAEVFAFLGVDPAHPGRTTPHAERNRTAGAVSRRPAVRRLQRSRVARAALDRLPTAAKGTAKRRLSPVVDNGVDRGNAVVTAELRGALQGLLRDDVRALREHLPPSFDGWGLLD